MDWFTFLEEKQRRIGSMKEIEVRDGMRFAHYTIDAVYEDYTIHRYLREVLHLSERIVRRIKYRRDGSVLDGQYVYMNERVHAGQTLTIRLSDVGEYDTNSESVWEAPAALLPPLEILYEDCDLIFLRKKDHVVCHPSPGHYADTLANQVAWHLGLARGKIFPIGRLDRDTSGIVLFAKNSDAAGILTVERMEGDYHKVYRAWVDGIVEEDSFTVDKPIRQRPDVLMVREVHMDGQEATTHATVVERDYERNRTLLHVTIEHGRTHQIRVHMAYAGHPICGDVLYNPKCFGWEEHPLHKDLFKEGNPISDWEPLKLEAFRTSWLSPYLREPQKLELQEEYK